MISRRRWLYLLPITSLAIICALTIFSIDYQVHHQKTILLKLNNSLTTKYPDNLLNSKRRQSSEFSISLIAATNRFNQVGPARIISLAENLSQRNMMIGQEGKNLTFRLRTPTTGETAAQPKLIIPNVFNERNLHQILITFCQRKLTFYIDEVNNQYTFEFHPATSSALYLPWTIKLWRINLQDFNFSQSRFIFYGIIIMPLAILFNTFILYLNSKLS